MRKSGREGREGKGREGKEGREGKGIDTDTRTHTITQA